MYKSNDDIPSRMSIPLPFVIMRENADKEQLVEQYERVFQNTWRICGFLMLMQIVWLFIGDLTPEDLMVVGRSWLIIIVVVAGTVFSF